LRSLQTRANENFPVQINGVVVGQVQSDNRLVVLDPSGDIEIGTAGPMPHLIPGQSVLISGVSQWNDQQVEIQKPGIKALESNLSDRPKWIGPGQKITPQERMRWVEIEGQIQFLTRSDHHLEFDLTEGGQNVPVHVLHFDPAQTPPSSGTRIRVNGLCDVALNEFGKCVIGNLWVSSMDALSPMEQTNAAVNSDGNSRQEDLGKEGPSLLAKIIQIRQLSRSDLNLGPHVKVRGVITVPSGTYIQDGTGGIEIWPGNLTAMQMPGLGAYVEIEGRAILSPGHGVAGYGPSILASKVSYLGNGKLPDPIQPSWSLLTSGQLDAEWIEVHGVVRATDGSHLLLACENGELMATIVSASVWDVNRLVDATIRVRGVSIVATDERGQMQGVQLVVPSMQFVEVQQAPVENAALPLRSIGSLIEIRGLKEMIHRVKIEGVLTGFANNNYFIQDSSGSVRVIARQDVTLSLPAGGWWSFWQSPRPNLNSYAATELKVGDRVEALGFPENQDYAPVLTKATVRDIGPASAVVPVKTTAAKLSSGELDSTLVTLTGQVLGSETWGAFSVLQIQSDQKSFQSFLPLEGENPLEIAPGTRVRLTGICQMEPVIHGELGKSPSAFSLLLRSTSDISLLEFPPWLTVKRALLAVGSLIVILCCAFVWIRLLHRQVESQTQQLRREIIEHEKTEGLLDRKTQLLQHEIQRHEKTEATLAEKTELLEKEIKKRESIYSELKEKKVSLEVKIEERKRIQMEIEKIHKQLLMTSRLAGMADVATNVLHNVGNVLNGVNVLAASIASFVQKSKASGVSRLAALLTQHEADLGRFMTDDENGKHVPRHLERLGAHLTKEQYKLLEKIKLLTDSIQHIKEIVAMQQNYAKVSGVWETVVVSEIVEDALKMCSEALDRHGVKVVRSYEETPRIILDRHKVLQILFNLIDNAKHACEGRNKSEKQITIKVHVRDNERVQVEVADNGIGISPANINHIFTQGFSTRKEGHGFGLHSSILAAQDMGGMLTVQSQGLEKGAVFILELPLLINKSSPAGAGDRQVFNGLTV
jgi:signal transduction histidine kinase